MQTPRKILITCAAYPPNVKGGGEKSTQLLAQGLSQLGHDVHVLTISDRAVEYLDTDGSTQVRAIQSPNIYWNFRPQSSAVKKLVWHLLDNFNPHSTRGVRGALEVIQPDVVISSTIENYGAGVWIACKAANIPVIHILRSYYTRCFKGTMFSDGANCETPCTQCRVLTWGRRQAALRVDGLVGISQFILDAHTATFPFARFRVIANAVKASPPALNTRERNGLLTFGYLGRIEPEKGVAEILAAFATLPTHCQLVVAGKGEEAYVSQLKTTYASDRIRFLGWVEADLVYPQIDFAIVPSLWNEPFGRVVIEAYAMGVPVIAAARGGLSELVDEGVTGYLFDPEQAHGLQNALLRASGNLNGLPQMSDVVRERAKRYAPDVIAQQYAAFVEDVLQKTGANPEEARP